jgi:uncharacterized protein (DUF952 family)
MISTLLLTLITLGLYVSGNHFYQAVPGDYLLLVIDAEKLKAKVKFSQD